VKVDFQKMSPQARMWIYQSSEPIVATKVESIRNRLQEFTEQWAAHQQPLAAWGEVLHSRFIVLGVDGRYNQPSGCSIDESVAFIRALEQEFALELFDRMTFSYQKDGQVYTVPREQFQHLYQSGEISDQTMVFDNLVSSKEDFDDHWLKPLAQSWHHRFV